MRQGENRSVLCQKPSKISVQDGGSGLLCYKVAAGRRGLQIFNHSKMGIVGKSTFKREWKRRKRKLCDNVSFKEFCSQEQIYTFTQRFLYSSEKHLLGS